MNKNDLIAAATSYMQIWNVNGDHLLDKLAATDLVVEYTHFPGPVSGIEHYRATLKATYGYFPISPLTSRRSLLRTGGQL